MVSVNEIRIGNFFSFERDDLFMYEHSKVKSIFVDGKYTFGKHAGEDIYMIGMVTKDGYEQNEHIIDIEPIELNKDILQKSGFTEDKEDDQIMDIGKLGYLYFSLVTFMFTFYKSNADVTLHVAIAHVKYLHQLQNLYFSLVGEELKVNLK